MGNRGWSEATQFNCIQQDAKSGAYRRGSHTVRVNTLLGGIPCGPERKNSVAHTVRALPTLALRAYASVGLRDGFANPAHTVSAQVTQLNGRFAVL